MKKNTIKRVLSLVFAVMLIISTFVSCGGAPETPHAVLSFNGDYFYYGMEIDPDKLLKKYPGTVISGSSYAISPEVSLILREVDGKHIIVAYFINTAGSAKIDGVGYGDSKKKYLSNFENSTEISSDATGNSVLGYYFYEGKKISYSKYYQYLNASRFEGTKAYEDFLNNVIVSTALSNGTVVLAMSYGDYHAIYDGK